MSLHASPMKLLFGSDVGQASAGVAEGNFLISGSLGTLLVDEAARPGKMITLGAPDGPRARGCIISPLVDDGVLDNVAITVGVYTINPIMAHNGKVLLAWNIDKIGSLACTAASLTATKDTYGSAAGGSYRAIDTIVYTPTALGTALGTAFDPAPSAHSPADNTQGRFIIPDAGGAYGVILDPFDAGSSAFNALVQKVT